MKTGAGYNKATLSIIILTIVLNFNNSIIAQNKKNMTTDTLTFVNPPNLGGTYTDFSPVIKPLSYNKELKLLNRSGDMVKDRNSCQPFANYYQNSRVPLTMPTKYWKIEWNSPINKAFRPNHILVHNDASIVESEVWLLFNKNGTLLKQGRTGVSHLLLDRKHSLFFYVNSEGEFTACQLTDGYEVFKNLLPFSDKYYRSLIVIRNNYLLMISNEIKFRPTQFSFSNRSIISKWNLSDLFNPHNAGSTKKLIIAGSIYIRSAQLIAAAINDDDIIFAYPNRLMIADSSLKIGSAYSDNFTPISISTDEAERIYLLNDNEKGRCLWAITKNGEKVYAVETPAAIVHPPIVGYDHRVFIPCEKNIAVIDQSGKQLMSYILKHKFKGAIVTADDKLLVCDGPELVVFDKNGLATVLYNFGSDELCTPPALSASGKILVASRQYLYCLEAK